LSSIFLLSKDILMFHFLPLVAQSKEPVIMSVKLFHAEPSFYSQVARLALAEKGVPYERIDVNIGPMMENYEPWYMKMHPEGVVPLLEHDGKCVVQTIDIIHYVSQSFPGPSLVPEDTELCAEMEDWLLRLSGFSTRNFSYGVQGIAVLRPLQQHSYTLRRKVLRKHMKGHPELAALYQARLDDIDTWQTISSNPAEVEALKQKMIGMLDDLEQVLSDGREWVVGVHYTLADVWWTVMLARLRQFKLAELWEEGARPKIGLYERRLKARPSFEEATIWEGIRPAFMVKMLAPFLLPRLGGLLLALGLLGWLVWFALG
jgi:glutathione S-transferase